MWVAFANAFSAKILSYMPYVMIKVLTIRQLTTSLVLNNRALIFWVNMTEAHILLFRSACTSNQPGQDLAPLGAEIFFCKWRRSDALPDLETNICMTLLHLPWNGQNSSARMYCWPLLKLFVLGYLISKFWDTVIPYRICSKYLTFSFVNPFMFLKGLHKR